MLVRTLAYSIVILAVVVAVGYLFLFQRFQLERDALLDDEAAAVRSAKGIILRDLQDIQSVVIIFRDTVAMQEFLARRDSESKQRLERILLLFMAQVGVYDQLRVIDNNGLELIRIDYNSGVPNVVGPENLQNKSNRYYFSAAMELDNGEVYVSPLDLNVENGEIEQPYKPVLRIATPLFGGADEPQALFVLNYLADELLTPIRRLTANQGHEVILLNDQGYWLSSPRHEDQWGFMWEREDTFASRHPQVWQRIRQEESGSFIADNYIYIFDAVFPLSIISPENQSPAGEQEHWIIVSRVPRAFVSFSPLASARQYQAASLGLVAASAFIGFMFAWLRTNNVAKTKALRTSERRLAEAQRLAHLGNWFWDLRSDQMSWSDEIYRIVQRTKQKFTPTLDAFMELVHPDDRDEVRTTVDRALHSPGPHALTHRIVRPSGEVRYLSHHGETRFDELGQPVSMMGTAQDISETVEAERALRESESRHRNLFENMGEGYALLETVVDDQSDSYDFRYLEVNPAFEHMLGITRKEVVGRTLREAFPLTENYWLELLKKVALSGRPVCEENYGRTVGRYLQVNASSPQPGLVALFFYDITERKQNELRLQQAAAVFKNTAESIMITDAEHNIEMVNQAFTEITGYTFDDVVGKTPKMLQSHIHDAEFYRRIWNHVDSRGRWQGEVWKCRQNGDTFPAWENISAITDETGTVTNYISVMSDISPVKRAQEELHRLAHEDTLTGLANRFMFATSLNHALERAKRHQSKLALLFLDLDRFKLINDSLGHDAGDQLLRTVATRLKSVVRAEDLIARLGGDEFTIIMEDITHPETAALLADKIIRAFADPVKINAHEVVTSTSIGISIYPDDGLTTSDLASAADAAMYQAKAKGRRTYRFYTSELTRRAEERLAVEKGLRQALKHNEFVLHYQPVVAIASGQIAGVEALLRWRHPERGLLPPESFIATAEDSGIIEPIFRWVLNKAFGHAKAWKAAGIPPVRMAINLSGHQLLYDHVLPTLQRALNTHDLNLGDIKLEFEITENVLQSGERAVQILTQMRNLGINIAIDDFGTGFSSLGQLKHLPIDTLKIDRGFLEGVPRDSDNTAFIAAIVSMGHSLGLRIVGEGVENPAQLRFLQEQGCDEAQGFLMFDPVDGDQITRLLRDDAVLDA